MYVPVMLSSSVPSLPVDRCQPHATRAKTKKARKTLRIIVTSSLNVWMLWGRCAQSRFGFDTSNYVAGERRVRRGKRWLYSTITRLR